MEQLERYMFLIRSEEDEQQRKTRYCYRTVEDGYTDGYEDGIRKGIELGRKQILMEIASTYGINL